VLLFFLSQLCGIVALGFANFISCDLKRISRYYSRFLPILSKVAAKLLTFLNYARLFMKKYTFCAN